MMESAAGTAAEAEALDTEARQALDAGDFTRARQLFEKVLAIWRSLHNTDEVIYGLIHVSQMMLFEPDYDPAAARPLLEEAWQLAQEEGMEACIMPVQVNLTILAIEEKEYGEALRLGQQLLPEGLQEADVEWKTGRIWLTSFAIIGLGHPEEGLRLYIAATALRQRAGIPDQPPFIQEHHRKLLAPTYRLLGPERVARLEAEGQAMPLEEAVATALAFTA
jgi:hypothetical protein